MRDVKEPEVRRAEIMEAAIRLFRAKGYLNTTTQDIISEVKISRGLLYYHFKNKEDILYCAVDKYSEPMLYSLKKIAISDELSAIEKAKQFIEATMISDDTITDDDTVIQDVLSLDENRYLMDRFSHKLCKSAIEYFTQIIIEGNEQGDFDVLYPKDTATFLITGYIFVSSDLKITCRDKEELHRYFDSFKVMLERTLNTKKPIF